MITRWGLYGLALVMLLLAPIKEGSLAALWTLWVFVQYVKWLPALNLPFEDSFPAFYHQIAKTFCPISQLFPAKRTPYQASFHGYCANSSLFLVNGAEMLVVLFGALAVLATVELVSLGAKEGLRLGLKVAARWSIVIRAVLLTELDLAVFAIIQLWNVNFDNMFEIANFVCAILYLLLLSLCGALFPVLIHRNSSQIAAGKCSPLFSTLICDLLPSLPALSYHYESLLLVQRLASALVFVLLWTYPKAQMAVLASTELVVLVALVWKRPFKRVDLIGSVYPHAAGIGLIGLESLIWTETVPQYALLLAFLGILWIYTILATFRYFSAFHCSGEVYSLETINSTSDDPPVLAISTEISTSHRPNEAYEAVARFKSS